MQYKWGKPNKSNFQDVAIKYYTFFDENFGKDILRNNTRKQLAKEKYINSLLFMDDNYKKTVAVLISIFKDKNIRFLTINNDNYQNMGYSRISLSAGGNPENAIVGEIVLSIAYDEQTKFDIYRDVIDYIEMYIKISNPNITTLTFEAPKMDLTYVNAIIASGYDLANEPNKDLNSFHTYLFDKNIKEKKHTRTVK